MWLLPSHGCRASPVLRWAVCAAREGRAVSGSLRRVSPAPGMDLEADAKALTCPHPSPPARRGEPPASAAGPRGLPGGAAAAVPRATGRELVRGPGIEAGRGEGAGAASPSPRAASFYIDAAPPPAATTCGRDAAGSRRDEAAPRAQVRAARAPRAGGAGRGGSSEGRLRGSEREMGIA